MLSLFRLLFHTVYIMSQQLQLTWMLPHPSSTPGSHQVPKEWRIFSKAIAGSQLGNTAITKHLTAWRFPTFPLLLNRESAWKGLIDKWGIQALENLGIVKSLQHNQCNRDRPGNTWFLHSLEHLLQQCLPINPSLFIQFVPWPVSPPCLLWLTYRDAFYLLLIKKAGLDKFLWSGQYYPYDTRDGRSPKLQLWWYFPYGSSLDLWKCLTQPTVVPNWAAEKRTRTNHVQTIGYPVLRVEPGSLPRLHNHSTPELQPQLQAFLFVPGQYS